MIKAAKEANARVIASDIMECAAQGYADDFLIVPKHRSPDLWPRLEALIQAAGVNVVVPSLDETLPGWAERKEYFRARGVHIILSAAASIALCRDKWETFRFFQRHGIPTAATSLTPDFPLLKPRCGRGGQGIRMLTPGERPAMDGMIAQELLKGQEYTIDIFCDAGSNPVYVIPRQRIHVRDGKSTAGITVRNERMVEWVRAICAAARFTGPINIQGFEDAAGGIKFTEINPRIAGGMALGFAASENWVSLMVSNLIERKPIVPVPVRYGLKMFRAYDEVFVT